jgi:maltose alpha-D-glucosyltransferase/alpha-amylase
LIFDRAALAAAVRELDLEDLASRRWYAAKGEVPSSARLAHGFLLAPDLALALVDVASGDRGEGGERYAIPFVVRDGAVREAAEGDGAWRALAVAIAEGRSIPAMARDGGAAPATGQVDAALVCRPSPGFHDAWGGDASTLPSAEEAPLGRDQSNTSTVLGGRLLLKAYRRLQPGLNPDLELTAYLSEEAAFPGVPRLAGWAEVVTRDGGVATVAMLQAFVADADDAYERTADFLADLVAAPGTVSMEWATEVAADLGTLVAGLHAALVSPPADAPDLAPRTATHDELKAWRMDAHRNLNLAIPAVTAVDAETGAELKREASAIAARVSRFEAVATAPLVMRIQADLHLGQVLVGEDGYRVIDFEGEPIRPIDERRRPDSPLRDVASMLRSLDHVARSAGRRAERLRGGPIERPGLDIDAWIERSRERFLAAYADGLRRSGAPITLDLDLLDAFEVAKEVYEFVYAATVLPSWLWAPRAGMRWLLAHGESA